MARGPGGFGNMDLTSGPIGKTLLAFAVPTLISSVLQSLNGSVNAIWVGRFLGEAALAATSNANLVLFLMMAFVFGFGMASTVMVGQAFGRRDVDGARRVIGTAVGTFAIVAGLVGALGWIFAPKILGLLGLASESQGMALAYLRVIFLAMPPIMVSVVLSMALRGAGDAMTPLWFMVGAVVLDAGLNPMFILGVGPFPRMGIAGAATATLIANVIAMAGLVAVIYWRDLPIRLRGAELRYLRPDPALLRRILAMGFPMGLQMIVISSASLAMLGLVNRQGVETTAAFGVALQLWTYIQMPAMALSAAVSAMAAQNIGAGLWDRVDTITWRGVGYNLVITGVLVVVLAIADRPALALFLGSDSPALPIAQHIQLIVTWSFLLFGVTMVVFGTMRANGAVVTPLIILFVSQYPVRLGFAVGGQAWLGPDALWAAFPLSSLVAMLLAVAAYRQGGWRKRARAAPPRPSPTLAAEEALAVGEPGGRIQPSA